MYETLNQKRNMKREEKRRQRNRKTFLYRYFLSDTYSSHPSTSKNQRAIQVIKILQLIYTPNALRWTLLVVAFTVDSHYLRTIITYIVIVVVVAYLRITKWSSTSTVPKALLSEKSISCPLRPEPLPSATMQITLRLVARYE